MNKMTWILLGIGAAALAYYWYTKSNPAPTTPPTTPTK